MDDEAPLTEIPLTALYSNSVQEAELLADLDRGAVLPWPECD